MRRLLGLLVCLVWIGSTYAQNTDIQIDAQRLEENRITLSQLSPSPKEANQNEIIATKKQGRALLMRLMREAGLRVHIDYAGNIIGNRPGWDVTFKPISIGSSLKSTSEGNVLDGYENALVAVEVVKTLMDNDLYTDHPLELIIFAEDHIGVAGSQALIGQLDQQYLSEVTPSGVSISNAIAEIGGQPDKVDQLRRAPGSLAAFIEVIEMPNGEIMPEKTDMLIVNRMIEEHQWSLTIERNTTADTEAGLDTGQFTTNDICDYLQELTSSVSSEADVRLGRIRELITTSIHSMGKLQTTLTIQNQSNQVVDELYQKLSDKALAIEKHNGIKISFDKLPVSWAEKLDPQLQEIITNTARTQGLNTLFTDAGTDNKAHELSVISRSAAMVFPDVNSQKGSHIMELKKRADFLLQTLLDVDLALRKSSSPLGGN